MTKGLLITHGQLGRELIDVAQRILEREVDITSLAFDWQDDGTSITVPLKRFVNANKNSNIILFTDMFGGSPYNISMKYFGPGVEVITGINLPGLLKFLTHCQREMPFADLVGLVRKGIMDGVTVLSEHLGEKTHG